MRWVLKDTVGVELPPPARKTIDLEGRVVKDGIRKELRDRQLALAELVRGHTGIQENRRDPTINASRLGIRARCSRTKQGD